MTHFSQLTSIAVDILINSRTGGLASTITEFWRDMQHMLAGRTITTSTDSQCRPPCLRPSEWSRTLHRKGGQNSIMIAAKCNAQNIISFQHSTLWALCKLQKIVREEYIWQGAIRKQNSHAFLDNQVRGHCPRLKLSTIDWNLSTYWHYKMSKLAPCNGLFNTLE